MQHTSELTIAASMDDTLAVLSDLSSYPSWNEIVKTVEPDPSAPAWFATLEARLGPLARSKRLRMIREPSTASNVVAFVREEPDRERYAQWRMQATVIDTASQSDHVACLVQLELSYDGDLWTAPLAPVLATAIDRAVQQLPDYVQRTAR